MELLLKLLPRYYAHVERYPHTLLIKFFGLHASSPPLAARCVPVHSNVNCVACEPGACMAAADPC